MRKMQLQFGRLAESVSGMKIVAFGMPRSSACSHAGFNPWLSQASAELHYARTMHCLGAVSLRLNWRGG